jgi:hypothetical protein
VLRRGAGPPTITSVLPSLVISALIGADRHAAAGYALQPLHFVC